MVQTIEKYLCTLDVKLSQISRILPQIRKSLCREKNSVFRNLEKFMYAKVFLLVRASLYKDENKENL